MTNPTAKRTRRAPTFFIHLDTYWQGAYEPDKWVGPFVSRKEARAAIDYAKKIGGGWVYEAGKGSEPADKRRAIKVLGIESRTKALRAGMVESPLPEVGNVIDEMPSDSYHLLSIEFKYLPF